MGWMKDMFFASAATPLGPVVGALVATDAAGTYVKAKIENGIHNEKEKIEDDMIAKAEAPLAPVMPMIKQLGSMFGGPAAAASATAGVQAATDTDAPDQSAAPTAGGGLASTFKSGGSSLSAFFENIWLAIENYLGPMLEKLGMGMIFEGNKMQSDVAAHVPAAPAPAPVVQPVVNPVLVNNQPQATPAPFVLTTDLQNLARNAVDPSLNNINAVSTVSTTLPIGGVKPQPLATTVQH